MTDNPDAALRAEIAKLGEELVRLTRERDAADAAAWAAADAAAKDAQLSKLIEVVS